jgi:hypothetical protein
MGYRTARVAVSHLPSRHDMGYPTRGLGEGNGPRVRGLLAGMGRECVTCWRERVASACLLAGMGRECVLAGGNGSLVRGLLAGMGR